MFSPFWRKYAALGMCEAYLCLACSSFQLWQQDNHPGALYDAVTAHQKLDYLHINPVTAGFVAKPEDWLYSSATDYYAGKKGMIDVLLIDPMIVTI